MSLIQVLTNAVLTIKNVPKRTENIWDETVYVHSLNEKVHTGGNLLSLLTTLEKNFWKTGLRHEFEIQQSNEILFKMKCLPQRYQTGSGILFTGDDKAYPWKRNKHGLTPCIDNLHKNDQFPRDFLDFLTSPIKDWKDSEDVHVFLILIFEIARRVEDEIDYPLIRDELIEGISIAMANWTASGVRDLLVQLFTGTINRFDRESDERRKAYDELLEINEALSPPEDSPQSQDAIDSLTSRFSEFRT